MEIDYAKAIKMGRAARGMTQAAVASRARISTNYLSLIESGARHPSTAVVEAIAASLGVPVWALVVLGSADADVAQEVRGMALGALVT